MNDFFDENKRSAYSVLKSEILLLLFAALVSLVVSISFSYYLDFLKSYNQNKRINKALYFEVMRNNFAMWELMSNITAEVKNDSKNRLYLCFPYDSYTYKAYSEKPTSLPSEIDYLLNEFYSLLFRMNYICELVVHDFKSPNSVQIQYKKNYFNLLQSAMNIGDNVMRKIENEIDIPTNYDAEHHSKMEYLRKQVFGIHPELKEKLGTPKFIYDEKNNRMILKEYE